ncbi:hypothetical protein K438DRAFT_426206 [Mycena galopus ATCC 62051]|nr:hypothetical protein K438DRAFT_426206 [Mycena galopus ATCC 62051]
MAKKKQSQQAPDVIEIMSSDEEPPVSSKKIQKAAASIKTNVKNAGASATNQFTKKSGRQRSTALVGVSGDTGAGPSRLSSIASGSSDQTNYPASRNGIDTLTPKRLRLDTGSSTTNPVLKKPRTNDNIEAVSANSDGEAHSAPDDLKAYLKSLRDAGLEGTDALGIEYPEFDDEILRLIDLVGDSKACLAAYAKERADFVDRFLHRILDGTDLEDAKAANHFPFLTSRAKVQLFGYNQPRAGEKMFTINQNGDWERSSHWSSISCHEMWFDQIDINGHSIQRLRAAFLACLRLPPCAHLGKAIDRARATGLDYVPLAWLSEGVAFDGTCFGIYSLLPPAKGIALADAVRARTEAGIMPQRPHPPPPPPSATPKTSQGGYAGMTIVDMEYRRGGHDYKAVNQLCEAVRAEYPFHKWEMGQVFGFPQSQRPEIPTARKPEPELRRQRAFRGVPRRLDPPLRHPQNSRHPMCSRSQPLNARPGQSSTAELSRMGQVLGCCRAPRFACHAG